MKITSLANIKLEAWYRHRINMQTTLQALHRPKLLYRLFKASGRPVNFLISRSETGLNDRTGLLQAVYQVKQDVYRLVTIQIFYYGKFRMRNLFYSKN